MSLSKGLDLIVVDHLGAIKLEQKVENRAQEVAKISAELKSIAMELNVPLIAISHQNREYAHRPTKRPMLSDLRDSGAIEQDADIVLFLYREDYYEFFSGDMKPKNITELIVAKHRSGPRGVVKLVFDQEHERYRSMDAHRS